MACSRCGASRKPVQVPSGIRPGTKPSSSGVTIRSDTPKRTGVRESITGLRYVPSGK